MIAVVMLQMLFKAVPDWLAGTLMMCAMVLLVMRRSGPLPLMLAGGAIGWLALT